MQTRELTNVIIEMPIEPIPLARQYIQPSVPWADDHFEERVSGVPLNPPPSEAWWPYAQHGNQDHKDEGTETFSHTYPERFWPKFAGEAYADMVNSISLDWTPHMGIRYNYGDLEDVVELLNEDPTTRQAYLPIWFPEDTGATKGQRVPCTLGYHFLLRDQLNVTYHIRSCDFLRHFRDDVYMAMRLGLWMCDRVIDAKPGKLVMHIGSFHIFEGDVVSLKHKVEMETAEAEAHISRELMSVL
jgi:thymidylate synthase